MSYPHGACGSMLSMEMQGNTSTARADCSGRSTEESPKRYIRSYRVQLYSSPILRRVRGAIPATDGLGESRVLSQLRNYKTDAMMFSA